MKKITVNIRSSAEGRKLEKALRQALFLATVARPRLTDGQIRVIERRLEQVQVAIAMAEVAEASGKSRRVI